MEITRQNINERINIVTKSISKASFIAFDLEFTGVNAGLQTHFTESDSIQVRYAKVSQICERFWPCQIGISCFRYVPSENLYKVRTFNINLLPYGKFGDFNMQYDAAEFLLENGYSFNKLIQEGVGCCRIDELDYYRNLVIENEPRTVFEFSHVKQELFKQLEEQLLNFVNDDATELFMPVPNIDLAKAFVGKNGPGSKFSGLSYSYRTMGNSFGIQIKKAKKAQVKYTQQDQDNQTFESDILKKLGGTIIIKHLIESQKPIIGHSLMFDIIFIYVKFVGDLPIQVSEFMQNFRRVFTEFYDTKCIARNHLDLTRQIDLEGLYSQLTRKNPYKGTITILMDDQKHSDFNRYLDNKAAHEAGYDAYITGSAFAIMTHYLTIQNPTIAIENQIASSRNVINVMGYFNRQLNFDVVNQDEYNIVPLRAMEINDTELGIRQLAIILNQFGDVTLQRTGLKQFYARYSEDNINLEEIALEMSNQGFNIKLIE